MSIFWLPRLIFLSHRLKYSSPFFVSASLRSILNVPDTYGADDVSGKEVSDAELLHRVEGGDDDQFALFIRRHEPWLKERLQHRTLPQGVDVDDIIQEVWMRLLRHLRGKANSIDVEQNIAGYISGIVEKTRLHFFQFQNAQRRGKGQMTDSLDRLFTPPAFQDRNLLRLEQRETLDVTLSILPKDTRTAIVLHAQGYERKEIAEQLHSTTDAITKKIQRGMLYLRSVFDVVA